MNHFVKMTGAGSTRMVGKMVSKIILLIVVQHVAALQYSQNWYGVKLTDKDIEENMPLSDHATVYREENCLFRAADPSREYYGYCFGDYDGQNCHLMKIRRLPTGREPCGQCGFCEQGPGLRCETKFSIKGEFLVIVPVGNFL